MEYLLWHRDLDLPAAQQNVMRVLEEGFDNGQIYSALGREAAVPLTNSVSLADGSRMRKLLKQKRSNDYEDACPFRYGQLLIVKAFIGKVACCPEGVR